MRKIWIGLAGMLLLGAGLGVGWYLVGQRQLFGKKAAVVGGTAQIRLSPEVQSTQTGSSFPVNVLFSAGPTAISAVTIQLDYNYTGTEPPLGVSSMALDPDLLGTGEWSVPIKTFTAANGQARVRIAAINTSLNGFSSASEVRLATLTFQANNPGTINVSFDATESKVTTKSSGSDVLLIPTSSGVYTAMAIPTPTQTALPTATIAPTAMPGPTATMAPGETPFPQPQNSGGGDGNSGGGGQAQNQNVEELPKSGGGMALGLLGALVFVGMGLGLGSLGRKAGGV